MRRIGKRLLAAVLALALAAALQGTDISVVVAASGGQSAGDRKAGVGETGGQEPDSGTASQRADSQSIDRQEGDVQETTVQEPAVQEAAIQDTNVREPAVQDTNVQDTAPQEPAAFQKAAILENSVGQAQTENSVASVTVDGETAYYDGILEAWKAAQGKKATVRVLKEATLGGYSDTLKIDDGATDITLEMAEGVSVSGKPTKTIEVRAGSLTMKSGRIINHNYMSTGVYMAGGSFRMEGGYLEVLNFEYPLNVCCGIRTEEGSNSSVFISGGEILAGYALNMKDSKVIITGGNFTGKGRNYFDGYGILVRNCDASISGGTFQTIKYDDGSGVGNAINVLAGSVKISGGIFREGTGRGICARANGDGAKLELSGGSFYGDANVLSGLPIRPLEWLEEGYAYYREDGSAVPIKPGDVEIKGAIIVKKCTAHVWGDWVPDPDADGVHISVCSVCRLKKEEAHTLVCTDISGSDVTGGGGSHRIACGVCGYSVEEPHTFGPWAYTGDAACVRECTACKREQSAGFIRSLESLETTYASADAASLWVRVTGAEASCEWKKQGEEQAVSVEESYTLPADLPAGSHTYSCAITLEGDDTPVVTLQYLVRVTPASIEEAAVEIHGGMPVYYDGTPKRPDLAVTRDGQTLTEGVDYRAVFQDNTEVGEAKLLLTGIGNYAGTITKSFAISYFPTAETATAPEGWQNRAQITAPAGFTVSPAREGPFAAHFFYDRETGAEGAEVGYYLKQDGTGYITEEKSVSGVKVDTTRPSMSGGEEGIRITDRDAWWQKLLTALSFGYYHPQQVTIKASDSPSGVDRIYYYIEENPGEAPLTSRELDALAQGAWKELGNLTPVSASTVSGSFGLTAEGRYVVYAVAVDQAGNKSAYISSDGIVIDTTALEVTLASPKEEALLDTSAVLSLQMDEAGTVAYVVSETERTGITPEELTGASDKISLSVTEEQAGEVQELRLAGLKAHTPYYVYAVGTDRAGNVGSVASVSFTTQKTALSGTVTLAGEPVFGETLRADVQIRTPDPGTVTYQWYRVGADGGETPVSGAVSPEYKLTAEDVGFSLQLKVQAGNCSGELRAAAAKTGKANAPGDTMPENGQADDSLGADTFTFTGKEGTVYEYSVDGGKNWENMENDALKSDVVNPGKVIGTIKVGNVAFAPGEIQVRAKETGTHKAGEPLKNKEAFTVSLEGSVSLAGTAKYGEILTAEVNGAQAGASLVYTFYRSGQAAPIQTGSVNTYTLRAEDIGKTLQVRVTAAGFVGALEAATGPVEKGDGREISGNVTGRMSHTETVYTYTVTAIPGASYCMDDGPWQDSPVFEDIVPGTSHTFYAKMPETDCYKEGPQKDTGPVSFLKLTPAAPALGYAIERGTDGNIAVLITEVSGAEYSFDGGSTWGDTPRKGGLTVADTVELAVRLKGTSTHNVSPAATASVDLSRDSQDAPAPFCLSFTANGETDYTVTIPATEGCEYSFDGSTWGDSNERTGVMPEEIVTGYKRYKETADKNASGAVSATESMPKFTVKTPVIFPAGGSYTSSVNVTITCGTVGARIYYTTDGTAPGINSHPYTGPFAVTAPATVRAIALKDGMNDSPQAAACFTRPDTSDKGEGGSGSRGNGGGSSTGCSGGGNETGTTGPGIGNRNKGIGGDSGFQDGNRGNTGRKEGLAADGGKPGNREPFIKETGADGRPVKSGWRRIREEEEKAPEGSTIHVDMNGFTEVPGNIFDTIRNRDITITFDLGGGILWSVNGKEIVTDKTQDIDFSVKTGGTEIPADIVRHLAGERNSIQLHLTHSGEWGLTARLSLQVGREYAGRNARLYYYQEDVEEMAFMGENEIGQEGIVELAFTHASAYLVVIGEPEADDREAGAGGQEAGEGNAGLERPFLWALLALAAIFILTGVLYLKAKRHEK